MAAIASPALVAKTRRNILALALPFVLLILCLLNVTASENGNGLNITPTDVVHTVIAHMSVHQSTLDPADREKLAKEGIIWGGRLPRTIGAVLIGMCLALSGVAFQSFLQNPLADPYMIGVSSGAALGSSALVLLGGTGWLLGTAQPLGAFLCGLGAVAIVTWMSKRNGRVQAKSFLLAGVVMGTFLWSLIPLMMSLAERNGSTDRQSAMISQLLGHLTNVGWPQAALVAPFALIGSILLLGKWQELNLLTAGEESAASMGLEVEPLKRLIIFAGALATAATVAVAGIIAFVGLVTPHLARRIVGPDHRRLLPASLWLGGCILVGSDLISRLLPVPLEIGVVTSLIGAPVFCLLLRRG